MFSFFAVSCSTPSHRSDDLPKPALDLPPTNELTATAVFAGGCFWCTEAVYTRLSGVTKVLSGYSGGTKETADYETVCSGRTGHAEAIQIAYDPSKISFGQLLRVLFTTIDPTQKDGQGPDWGHQYRSAIFYETEDQKRVAKAYIDQLNSAKVFPVPIATTIEPLTAFYPAEQYHKDFVALHPNHPYVRQVSMPKVDKLKAHFADDLKPSAK